MHACNIISEQYCMLFPCTNKVTDVDKDCIAAMAHYYGQSESRVEEKVLQV